MKAFALFAFAPVSVCGVARSLHPQLMPRAVGDTCATAQGYGKCQTTRHCAGVSYAQNYCPEDPKDVQCCVELSCKPADQAGLCSNTYKGCAGGSFHSGFCPGDSSVQCCVKNAPAPPAIRAPNPECVHPPRDSCDFYSVCLEDKYHCGPDGYPIGYGLKFCNLFGDAKPRFTPQGQKWVSDTMLCLQTALVPYATDQTTSCANLKTFAFGTHPRCYVDSGYCNLPKEDLAVIQSLIDPKELFSSLDSIKAVLQTAIECTAVYRWWIDNRVVRVVGNVGGKAGDVWRKVTSWF